MEIKTLDNEKDRLDFCALLCQIEPHTDNEHRVMNAIARELDMLDDQEEDHDLFTKV